MSERIQCRACKSFRRPRFITDGHGDLVDVTPPCPCGGIPKCRDCDKPAYGKRALRCRECKRVHHNQLRVNQGRHTSYYARNRERQIATAIKWQKDNPERYTAKARALYRRNRDAKLAYSREYYQKNRDKRLAQMRERYEADKERITAERNLWRQMKREAAKRRAA